MWAETKDRAWPWHGRRAALRHPDRASSGSPDDARSGNAAGDRGTARRLFSERGYFATKVDDIAALARVAPATVYAVSGGKQGLLRTLTETTITDPAIEATIGSIEKLGDPSAILRLVAATVRTMGNSSAMSCACFSTPRRTTRPFARAWPLLRPATAMRSFQSPGVLWICPARGARPEPGGRCVLVQFRLFRTLYPA